MIMIKYYDGMYEVRPKNCVCVIHPNSGQKIYYAPNYGEVKNEMPSSNMVTRIEKARCRK